MIELLSQAMVDFMERPLPSLTPRQARLPWLPGKIDTVTGMRRSGKTYFLYQRMAELLRGGTPRESLLYLNFEDERFLPLRASDVHLIPDTFYRLYPAMKRRECAFFFDEIQNVEGWERFTRRLIDTERVHLCLTGSSGRLLGREIATSLRGRALETEIFPFSFEEALRHASVNLPRARLPGSESSAELQHRFETYLFAGGFPEVQGIEKGLRTRILQEYVDVVLLRDVIERHRLSNTTALRQLVRHLLAAPGAAFSVHKFYNDLRSRAVAVAKDTLHAALDHLAEAFLLFAVPIRSRSERARMVNPRKVYPIDTGLARALSREPGRDEGRLLETVVFLDLRRRGLETEYLVTAGGREVDFAATAPDGAVSLVQVCVSLRDPETRSREVEALSEGMAELRLRRGTLVTHHETETLETGRGSIRVVPAWRFLLRHLYPID
jgi:hypothetical protein